MLLEKYKVLKVFRGNRLLFIVGGVSIIFIGEMVLDLVLGILLWFV